MSFFFFLDFVSFLHEGKKKQNFKNTKKDYKVQVERRQQDILIRVMIYKGE
jgi:hypothetical protein